MKYIDEYRDADLTRKLLADIQKTVTRPWTLMEVCGGQTHSIIKSGLDRMLPPEINLIHGPGCPVCVTPLELVDKAIALASLPEVIFTSYGDMLRVPGSARDLFAVKAAGGDVRIVYSPLDALQIARDNPDKTVVFFAIGFETTAPANAMAVLQAKAQGLTNFAVLVSHVTVPAAITALMDSPDVQVDGFLAAGHVCTVMGYWEYEPLAEKYHIPIVVTGFEPVDILHGILDCVQAVGSRQVRGAECLRPLGHARWQPACPGRHPESLRDDRPGLARHRRHPHVGLPPAGGVRLLRCRTTLPGSAVHRDARESRCASAGWCCRDARNPANARLLARNAPRRPRSARPWFPRRAPVRRITAMEDIIHITAIQCKTARRLACFER